MDPFLTEWLNALFRWVHVVAGVLWIGLLYFFNWVNAHVAKTYDADSKKKVVPELMPRALYWFRWGAAYTWISGVLILGVIIYMGGVAVEPDSEWGVGMISAIGIGELIVAFFVYDMLWKAIKNETTAVAVSFVLLVALAYGLSLVFTPRAVFIQIGSTLGTIMAANVWMRIWPMQRKIIAATRDGQAPDAAWGAMAALRSKHNTYMSVPLIFFMLSSHFPTLLTTPTVSGQAMGWVGASLFVLVGWFVTKLLYAKAAGEAPKKY